MGEARAPNNYELAEADYIAGMKYKDIAAKYNVTLNTVKSWKTRYEWSKGAKKGVHTKSKKVCTQKEAVASEVESVMSNDELNDKQRLFCLYYSKTFNATQSYQKAYGCSYENACSHAYELWKNVEIKKEVQRLSQLKAEQIAINETDLLELHMRIAFADIGNYVSFGKKMVPTKCGEIEVSSVELNESKNVDTQLIKEIKEGKDGVSVKLIDRCKSMDWLDKYFSLNPYDKHKLEYDKKKIELMQAQIDNINKDKDTGEGGVMIVNDIPKPN